MGLTLDDVCKEPFRYMKVASKIEGQIAVRMAKAERDAGHKCGMPPTHGEALNNIKDPSVLEKFRRSRGAAVKFMKERNDWVSSNEIRTAIGVDRNAMLQITQRLMIEGIIVKHEKTDRFGKFLFRIAQDSLF